METCPQCEHEMRVAIGGEAARCRYCGQVYEWQDEQWIPLEDYDLVGEGQRIRYRGVEVQLGRHGVFVDSDRLERRIKHKIWNRITGFLLGCVLIPVFIAVFAGLVVGISYYAWTQSPQYREAYGPGPAVDADWDGSTPFVCTSGSHRISGVTATFDAGTAVTASANCVLLLEGVKLEAPVALEATANAEVTVRGGTLEGDTAVLAKANARVTLEAVVVLGETKALANAEIVQ